MAAPANDNLANAQVLAAGTTQVTGTVLDATAEGSEVRGNSDGTGTSGSFVASRTVWYSWTAPASGSGAINTSGSASDTVLTVFQPKAGIADPVTSVGNLDYVTSDDDSGGGASSAVNFSAVPGRTYYIQIFAFSGTSDFTLNYPAPGFSLFTSQTPTGTNNSDGTPGITTATSLMFAEDGFVNAIRFRATTTVSGTYTGALWQVTGNDDPGPGAGTLLASKVRPTAPTGGAWNLITFDTPVAVTAGTLYRAGLHSSAGRYVNTANGLASGVTNGDITAPASGGDPAGIGTIRNGTFAINAALTYPATVSSASNYFVDVDFTPDTGGGPATINGAATVAGAGSVTATATQTVRGTASVTGAGSTSTTVTQRGAAAITGTGSASATGSVRTNGTASVTGAGVVSAAAVQRSGATVVGAGTVTAAAGGTVTGTAAVTGAGSVTAAATVRGTAGTTGAGTVSAAATLRGTATVVGAGVATANAGGIVSGAAAVSGAGTITALATQRSGKVVTGAGSVTGAGIVATLGTATLVGAGSVAATVRQLAGASVTGLGQVSATSAGQITYGTATVAGQGFVTASSNSRITPRPYAGITSRPSQGITPRP